MNCEGSSSRPWIRPKLDMTSCRDILSSQYFDCSSCILFKAYSRSPLKPITVRESSCHLCVCLLALESIDYERERETGITQETRVRRQLKKEEEPHPRQVTLCSDQLSYQVTHWILTPTNLLLQLLHY